MSKSMRSTLLAEIHLHRTRVFELMFDTVDGEEFD